MFEEIKKMGGTELGWAFSATSPEEMSNLMLANTDAGGKNLNSLSYDSTAKLLKHVLSQGFKVKRILLDALGPAATHIKTLRFLLGSMLAGIEMSSESKADDTYPVVSAASIVAKVTRDQ